ncbi:MAG: four helix bundle protein [Roseivirga sp.]
MAKVTRFEDLRCWQLARKLTHRVYTMADEGKLARDLDTKSQFKSAGLSVMNNIAEGFGRYSDKDFLRFLDYSAASCTEVKSMSYLLLDMEYFSVDVIESLQRQVEETRATVLGLMKYLRNKNG